MGFPVIPIRTSSLSSPVAERLRPLVPEPEKSLKYHFRPRSNAMPLQPMEVARRPHDESLNKPDIHGVPDRYGGHSEYPLTGKEYQAWIKAYSGTDIDLSEVEKPVIFAFRGFLAAPQAINEQDRLENVHHLFDASHWDHHLWFQRRLGDILRKYRLDAGIVSTVEEQVVRTRFCTGKYTPKTKIGRHISLDGHAILTKDQLILRDTHNDWRTQFNPLVQSEPYVSYYIGVPIYSKSNYRVGVLSFVAMWNRSHTPASLVEEMKELASAITEKIDTAETEPLLGSQFLQVLSPTPIWLANNIAHHILEAHRRGQMWVSTAQLLSKVLNVDEIAFYVVRVQWVRRKSSLSDSDVATVYPNRVGYRLRGYTDRSAHYSAKTYSLAVQTKAGICMRSRGLLMPFSCHFYEGALEKLPNETQQKLAYDEPAANIQYRNPEYFRQVPAFNDRLLQTCSLLVVKSSRDISKSDVSFVTRVTTILERVLRGRSK